MQSRDVVVAEFVGHVGETTSLVVAAGRAHLSESCPGLRLRAGVGAVMEESSLPFDSILADCLAYVRTAHGEVHAQRLFFELYNAIFTFLDRELGEASVDRYWEHLGSNSLGALSALVAEHGLDGMRRYWSRSLTTRTRSSTRRSRITSSVSP